MRARRKNRGRLGHVSKAKANNGLDAYPKESKRLRTRWDEWETALGMGEKR
jgi:hypothetical protein